VTATGASYSNVTIRAHLPGNLSETDKGRLVFYHEGFLELGLVKFNIGG